MVSLTDAWPDGWWIMTRELGRLYLMPGVPAARSSDAMLHACPTHHVDIGGRTYCIVSYMPSPAVTDPPERIKQIIGHHIPRLK